MATTTLEIVLTKTTDPSSLFEITDGADVAASMERFDGLLFDAVSERFPTADVSFGERGGVWDVTAAGDVNGADTPAAFEAMQAIQMLADEIHQDGSWIVQAE